MQTIVSIISSQLIPNYVFIKEKANPGDNLVFITTQKMKTQMEKLESVLKKDNSYFKFIEIIFDENDDENNYISMYAKLKNKLANSLNPNDEFLVNVTGGTKPMSMATKEIMHTLFNKVSYYYLPYPQNDIVSLDDNTKSGKLKYRISPNEYLSFYNINEKDFTCSKPKVDEAFTKSFLDKFKTFSNEDIKVIIQLLSYRDNARKLPYNLDEIENKGYGSKKTAINGIKDFIKKQA